MVPAGAMIGMAYLNVLKAAINAAYKKLKGE
jgi:hypothetical protein